MQNRQIFSCSDNQVKKICWIVLQPIMLALSVVVSHLVRIVLFTLANLLCQVPPLAENSLFVTILCRDN